MRVIHKAIQFIWSAVTGCRSTFSRLEIICETFRVPISLFFYFLSFSVVWNLQIFGRRWQYKSGEAAFCTFRRRWLFVLLSHDLFIFSSETKHLIWLFLCLNILKKTKIDCETISYSLFYGFLWRKDRRLIIHRDARGSWGLPPARGSSIHT